MIALVRALIARVIRRRPRSIRTTTAVRPGRWDDPATWRDAGIDTTGQFADGSIVNGKSYAGSKSAKTAASCHPAAINRNRND